MLVEISHQLEDTITFDLRNSINDFEELVIMSIDSTYSYSSHSFNKNDKAKIDDIEESHVSPTIDHLTARASTAMPIYW